MKGRILVVDDEAVIVRALVKYLEQEGYDVESAADGSEAIEKCKDKHFDLVLTDLSMPKVNGIELIREIKLLIPNICCVVMTAFGSIVSASDELAEVFNLVSRVADTDSTVLILGESGTGKELIARAIHYNSRRADHPLVPVNCGAIPENLLESELFGHVKGSFTGAINSKRGRFEIASGGTIFPDEIGDMSLRLQVKILRVLQERAFEPVGSTKTVEVDVRIITATNQNLEKLVEKGEFREDLYYRLNVIPVTVPPLRER